MSYKTLDQFELEPNAFYTGSYTDPIFSGSIYTNNRRVIAAHSSGSNELNLAQYYSEFADYSGSNRNRSRGIGLRFRHFFSVTERYHDTILPDIVKLFYANGGSPVLANGEFGASPILLNEPGADGYTIGGTAVGKAVFTTYGATASYESNGTNVADRFWFGSFPFQNTYKSITRVLEPTFYRGSIMCPGTESHPVSTGEIVKYGSNNGYPSSSLATVEVIIPRRWGDGLPAIGRGATEPVRYTLIDITGSVNAGEQFLGVGVYLYPPGVTGLFGVGKGTKRPRQRQLTKLFFGFGDNYQGVPLISAVTSSQLYTTIAVINGFYASSVDIRGWRYGAINGFPQYTSAIFRSGRYGQFRDMLEQRKYSKFFDPDGFTADGKNNGKKGSTEAVIAIRFVSGSDAAVTASSPSTLNLNDSGIYDFEYKSGQPFHDM